MNFDEYQKLARKTAIYDEKYSIIYPVLGLVGEAGELANKIKKGYRDEHGGFNNERQEGIRHELGDILWYIANVCEDFEFSMDEIAQENIKMLKSRFKRGKIKGSGDNR